MNRRNFLQFMGVSAAATAASTALAKLPEAESQIILLNKPKDIIIVNSIPNDVDFIINNLISVQYGRNENITWNKQIGGKEWYNPGMIDVTIEIETYSENGEFNFYSKNDNVSKFTFDIDLKDDKHYQLMELNGRIFIMERYEVTSSVGSYTMCSIVAREIAKEI